MAATGLTTTISTEGQVILPKAIRDQLQWHPGTRLTVERTADDHLRQLNRMTFSAAFPTRAGRNRSKR